MFDKYQNCTLYQTELIDDTGSSLSINLPFATAPMSKIQSPVRAQSPSHTTEELLGRMLAQMESFTIPFNMLKRENDNRIEEISQLAMKVSCSGDVETDRETTQRQKVTNDSSSEEKQECKQAQENLRLRNENIYAESDVRFPVSSAH